MVRKLFLMRHAAASDDAIRDFDRPLTGIGERTARHFGQWLLENEVTIEKIYSSSAVRALTTSEIIGEMLDHPVKAVPELYESSVRTFLQLVNETDPKTTSALFMGHNPTITYLAEFLTGEPMSFEPAGVAIINLDGVAWEEVGEKSGDLEQYLSPRIYAA